MSGADTIVGDGEEQVFLVFVQDLVNPGVDVFFEDLVGDRLFERWSIGGYLVPQIKCCFVGSVITAIKMAGSTVPDVVFRLVDVFFEPLLVIGAFFWVYWDFDVVVFISDEHFSDSVPPTGKQKTCRLSPQAYRKRRSKDDGLGIRFNESSPVATV